MKRGAYAILGVTLFLFGFVYVGTHMDDIIRWNMERDARAYEAMLVAEEEKLKQMEMADTYGGKTPEETVALIISALEQNDLVLASKYYYVLDQEKALASFKRQQAERGNMEIAITFFKDILRGTKKCNEEGDGCTLSYEYITTEDEYVKLPNNPEPFLIKKGSNQRKSENFQLNKYTGIWKAQED